MKYLLQTLFAFTLIGSATANNACCDQDDCSNGISVHADWLYWETCTDGVYAAVVGTTNGVAGPDFVKNSNVRAFNQDFETGFRFGLGYRNNDCCQWDVALNWVYFSPEADRKVSKSKISGDNPSFLPLLAEPIVFAGTLPIFNLSGATMGLGQLATNVVEELKAKWEMDLNFVDFEFGYKFCVGDCFTLRPHAGLRYLSLEQTVKYNVTGTAVTTNTFVWNQKFDNQFDGIGPRVGFGADWDLSCGLGLYGSTAVSVVYGEVETKHRELISSTPIDEGNLQTSDITDKGNHYCARPVTDLAVGLYYEADYCGYDYKLHAGWEHHYFFNFGAADLFSGTILRGHGENSGVTTQGLTLGLIASF